MSTQENLILDKRQTLQKIRRIAYEIYERNFQEQELVFAGIYDRGYIFAQILTEEFRNIAPMRVSLVKLHINKLNPSESEVSMDCPASFLEGKVVILIDDVLNTGATFYYSLRSLIGIRLAKLQTAVIVNRGHHRFPIAADYVGYTLSTTIRQHIDVVLDKPESLGVYLF